MALVRLAGLGWCGAFLLLTCFGVFFSVGAFANGADFRGAAPALRVHAARLAVCAMVAPIAGFLFVNALAPFSEAPPGVLPPRTAFSALVGVALFSAPFFLQTGAAWSGMRRCALAVPDKAGIRTAILFLGASLGLAMAWWIFPVAGFFRVLGFTSLAAAAAFRPLKGKKRRRDIGICLAAAIGLFLLGNQEARALHLMMPLGTFGAQTYAEMRQDRNTLEWGDNILYSRWTPLGYLSMLDTGYMPSISVFRDGILAWLCVPHNQGALDQERMLLKLVPRGARVLVLNAGAGKQTGLLLDRDPKEAVVLHDDPGVRETFAGEYAWAGERVFQDPRVTLFPGSARKFIETSEKKFDAICMAYWESPQGVFPFAWQPGQGLSTVEAFKAMRRLLNPGGALYLFNSMDRQGSLFTRTSGALARAGFTAQAWYTAAPRGNPPSYYMVFVARLSQGPEPPPETLSFFKERRWNRVDVPESSSEIPAFWDSSPWRLSIPGVFLGVPVLRGLFATCLALWAVVCIPIMGAVSFARPWKDRWKERRAVPWAALALGALCGASVFQAALWGMTRTGAPYAALPAGAAGCLGVWGLAALLPCSRALVSALGGLGLACALAVPFAPVFAVPGLLVVLCLCSGFLAGAPSIGNPGRLPVSTAPFSLGLTGAWLVLQGLATFHGPEGAPLILPALAAASAALSPASPGQFLPRTDTD